MSTTVHADIVTNWWLNAAVTGGALSHVLVLAVLLFVIGLFGLMFIQFGTSTKGQQSSKTQTSLLRQSLSAQLMLLAAVLVFVAAGRYWQTAVGQIIAVFVLVYAVIQVLLGYALQLVFNANDTAIENSQTDVDAQAVDEKSDTEHSHIPPSLEKETEMEANT